MQRVAKKPKPRDVHVPAEAAQPTQPLLLQTSVLPIVYLASLILDLCTFSW